MKFKLDDDKKQNILTYVISGAIIATIWFIFQSWSSVMGFFSTVWTALTPFVYGLVFAFIMLPIRRIIEEKWLAKTKLSKKVKRRWATAGAIITFILIIVLFFWILIPQLVSSLTTLASSMNGYMNTLGELIESLNLEATPEVEEIVTNIYTWFRNLISGLFSEDSQFLQTVMSYSVGVVKSVGNMFIGIVVAVYLLADSEKWVRQLRIITYSVWNKDGADWLCYFGDLTKRMLNGFLFGKAIDSIVIGIICGVVCALLRMPYVVLIAFVIGLTNMIPFFGPFIGAIPCLFLLVIISPVKALEFLIFIIILQQIDGNILGPYILGDSLGLPALWVMFSILVGGALFGIAGMILGVPLFSVFYVLIESWAKKRLKEKRIKL